MTNIELVHAYQAMDQLINQPMRPKNSYRLMKLLKKIQPICDSYNDAEMKLISDLNLLDKLEGRRIIFGDDWETAEKYTEAHKELDEMDSGVDPSWAIVLEPEDRISISPKDMLKISELISFAVEDENDA